MPRQVAQSPFETPTGGLRSTTTSYSSHRDTKKGEIEISKYLKSLMKSTRFSFLNVLGLFFLSIGIG